MNYLWAFCVGGAICLAGQLLIDLTSLTPARILTGYVVAGVVLSAAGWYEPLAQWAGCGATVPLLGFGHLLAKGVRTALAQQGPMGILTGGLTAASAGITACLVCGVVCSWLGRRWEYWFRRKKWTLIGCFTESWKKWGGKKSLGNLNKILT